MRSHAARDGGGGGPGDGEQSRDSRLRAGSMSGIPRPQPTSLRDSRVASFRATTTGASYSIAPGIETSMAQRPAASRAPSSSRACSGESFKENIAPADADEYEKYRKQIETLKAEIGTLHYRIQTADQEREIALSQHGNRLEQARRREQEETHRRQAADAERDKAAGQLEALRQEVERVREAAETGKRALEAGVREARDEARLLQEQLDDVASARDDDARRADKRVADLQMQAAAAEGSLRELQREERAREESLQRCQAQILDRDAAIGRLEADALRLKAQAGDAETVQIIKRELSEQVSHMRALEATNREQMTELKHLRALKKAVEIVEEEKRTLQRKVEAAETLEVELSEARIQRQRLEDERLAWAAYLKNNNNNNNNNASNNGQPEFSSPEAMARALVQERLTSASYAEQLGAARAEIAAHQGKIQPLQEEIAKLREQNTQAAQATSSTGASTDKVRLRLERQRALALKEVEYLRAQLRAFDTEEHTIQPEQFDEARAARIQELEDVVDSYKMEVQRLHDELAATSSSLDEKEAPRTPPSFSFSSLGGGSKRPRPSAEGEEEEEEDNKGVDTVAQERIGQLTRRNRRLQEEAAEAQTQLAMSRRDLAAAREQLSAAQEQSRTRILSLRSNPTSDHEAVQAATLSALRRENQDLLSRLTSRHSNPSIPLVPTSVLASMEREMASARSETASAHKSARRLKEVWASKSHEFKEAIFSTLGWTVTFIPNGKMRVESTFYPSRTEEHENSIVFDGERGTMKVGGGPRSAFAVKIADHIGFWVREKGCIPGFLAALTLEFYEEQGKK